jgi:hypothetical protein
MEIFCLEDFKKEFDKLSRKKAYKTLEQAIIDYFFNNSISDLKSGTRLNNCDLTPYIKKRLRGSGGYRIYFLILIKKKNVYLMFLHPKTGPDGADNITDESKSMLYKKVLECIKTNNLFKLITDDTKSTILFKKQKSV